MEKTRDIKIAELGGRIVAVDVLCLETGRQRHEIRNGDETTYVSPWYEPKTDKDGTSLRE